MSTQPSTLLCIRSRWVVPGETSLGYPFRPPLPDIHLALPQQARDSCPGFEVAFQQLDMRTTKSNKNSCVADHDVL